MNSRKKGIRYELEVRKKYKETGYKKVETSRYASKMYDDKGIDLVNTEPWLVQCKNYKNYSVSKAIENIKQIKKSKINGIPLIHVRITNKRKAVVIIDQDDFFKLLKNIKHVTDKLGTTITNS